MSDWPCEETTYDFHDDANGFDVRLWVTFGDNAGFSKDWRLLVERQGRAGGTVKDVTERIAEEGKPLGLAAVQVRNLATGFGHMIYTIPFTEGERRWHRLDD